ncbi:MAG: RNA-binding cell elongation regulator Jag/EloR [Bacillaceae bacterium]
MNSITTKGQSIEEAIELALNKLGVSREQIEYKVIEEGKKGFLGLFGNRPAIVEVAIKAIEVIEQQPEQSDTKTVTVVEAVETYLTSIFNEMKIDITINVVEKGRDILFQLEGDQAFTLIGKRGATLNALQQLSQLVANKHAKSYVNVILDAENYREKRMKTLEILANKIASQVIRTAKAIDLEPMPSFERKIIHQALTNHKYVETTSNGQEPNRYVTVSLKKNS